MLRREAVYLLRYTGLPSSSTGWGAGFWTGGSGGGSSSGSPASRRPNRPNRPPRFLGAGLSSLPVLLPERPPPREMLMGTNSPVLPVGLASRRRPFSSGTTATDLPKKSLNWSLPWSSASVSALADSGAIFSRKFLMMPVLVVSPTVPVSTGGRSSASSSGCTTGCCGAGAGGV